MKAFPNLKEGEVAVLLADRMTGHVLGLDLRWNCVEGGAVYQVFANEELAVGYVEALQASGKEVEGVLYGVDGGGGGLWDDEVGRRLLLNNKIS